MELLIDSSCENFDSSGFKNIFEECILKTLEYENLHSNVEISISIIDNNEIRTINKKYRNIDKETDVLSFPLLEKEDIINEFAENKKVYLGDIIISKEKAEKQAVEYNHPLEREIAFLTVHSCLHLIGYDHINKEEEKEMFLKQKEILDKAGFVR